MPKPLRVTVHDPETGQVSTVEVKPGNYLIICHEPCRLDGVQNHANGTTVLTIKGRAAQFMGLKEVAG